MEIEINIQKLIEHTQYIHPFLTKRLLKLKPQSPLSSSHLLAEKLLLSFFKLEVNIVPRCRYSTMSECEVKPAPLDPCHKACPLPFEHSDEYSANCVFPSFCKQYLSNLVTKKPRMQVAGENYGVGLKCFFAAE